MILKGKKVAGSENKIIEKGTATDMKAHTVTRVKRFLYSTIHSERKDKRMC